MATATEHSSLRFSILSRFFGFIACALFMAALPLALEQAGIFLCYFLGAIILVSRRLDREAVLFLSFLAIFVVLQVLINKNAGQEISYWQLARVSSYFFASVAIYALVACNKKFIYFFFRYEGWLAGVVFLLFMVEFVFDVRFYSASLVVEESSRTYVFSPMLFYLLLTIAAYEGRWVAFIYVILILATLQKSVIFCIALLLFMLILLRVKRLNFKRDGLSLILALLSFSYFGPDIVARFGEFLAVGDVWRLQEIMLGLQAYSKNMYSFIFGNGIGVPYRGFDYQMMAGESERLAVNMAYDVHNLYVDVLMKFGAFFAIFYSWFMVRQFSRLPKFFAFSCFSFFIVQGLSSPALILSIDALGFMFGLGLLVGRFKFLRRSQNFQA